jgi:hypothetical protein
MFVGRGQGRRGRKGGIERRWSSGGCQKRVATGPYIRFHGWLRGRGQGRYSLFLGFP